MEGNRQEIYIRNEETDADHIGINSSNSNNSNYSNNSDMESDSDLSLPDGRWRDLDRLFLRQGNVVGPGFEPGPEVSF